MSRRLIFGGAFNPVHVGHLRAAIEVSDRLGFERVEWVPSYAPLHKADDALLPFAMRVALLRAALDGDRRFVINTIEQELPTPSFTVQTLEAMTRHEPQVERHFLIGNREFLRLPQWRAGARVVEMTQLVIVCRTEIDLDDFAANLTRAWPHSRQVAAPPGAMLAFDLASDRQAVLVAIPRIDISSSLVRRYWLEGRSVSHLMPAAAVELLEQHRPAVHAAWTAAAGADLRAS
jgi:nicotinate-nucleotide adenylyltransferase